MTKNSCINTMQHLSHLRPCVFAVLDTASRVHLWDLGAGDIYPAHTVQFEDAIAALALNPDLGVREGDHGGTKASSSSNRQKQLLALGMENGKVEVIMERF